MAAKQRKPAGALDTRRGLLGKMVGIVSLDGFGFTAHGESRIKCNDIPWSPNATRCPLCGAEKA